MPVAPERGTAGKVSESMRDRGAARGLSRWRQDNEPCLDIRLMKPIGPGTCLCVRRTDCLLVTHLGNWKASSTLTVSKGGKARDVRAGTVAEPTASADTDAAHDRPTICPCGLRQPR
jgi:hypothetical protein